MSLPTRLVEWLTDEYSDEEPPLCTDADFHWEICTRCNGDGTLGGWPGAFTESDRAEWSADDYDDYRSYRRSCEDCGGTGKVRELNPEAEARPEVAEFIRDYYEDLEVQRMESRYCG